MFTPSQFIEGCNIDDAYDKLHAENKKMRVALEKIIRVCEDEDGMTTYDTLTDSVCYIARKALGE